MVCFAAYFPCCLLNCWVITAVLAFTVIKSVSLIGVTILLIILLLKLFLFQCHTLLFLFYDIWVTHFWWFLDICLWKWYITMYKHTLVLVKLLVDNIYNIYSLVEWWLVLSLSSEIGFLQEYTFIIGDEKGWDTLVEYIFFFRIQFSFMCLNSVSWQHITIRWLHLENW